MGSSIFLPKKINVGFQNRNGTYTGKLAYIIYFDEKGTLRKEGSWNSWRDQKIPNEIYENEPTSGFVLNKKVGDYVSYWNHRQAYVRVYDPRGFEFEITIENLLFILENSSSIKGKGLEGEFVYGWDGKELILIPVDAPDYKEITAFNEIKHANNSIKAKELKIGGTYLTKDNEEFIYMGKFDEYTWSRGKKKTKSFYFYTPNRKYPSFQTMSSISKKFIAVVSEECVENYADLFDKLECNTTYSPVDDSKNEYIPYTKEELEEHFGRMYKYVYSEGGNKVELIRPSEEGVIYYKYKNPNYVERNYWNRHQHNNEPYELKVEFKNMDELIEKFKPCRKRQYLANGKIYSEGF